MKINFKEIVVTDLDGNNSTVDVSKELGNTIFQKTTDLGELEFAREMYKEGEIEVSEQHVEMIRRYMDIGNFYARIKSAVNELFNDL